VWKGRGALEGGAGGLRGEKEGEMESSTIEEQGVSERRKKGR
jgi:hypothetical protein